MDHRLEAGSTLVELSANHTSATAIRSHRRDSRPTTLQKQDANRRADGTFVEPLPGWCFRSLRSLPISHISPMRW